MGSWDDDSPSSGRGMPSTEGGRPRIVYVADTTANTRMLDGLARHVDITLLARRDLGDAATTFWPPRSAEIRRVLLRGGRIGFALRAAWWLLRRRGSHDAVVALDALVAAAAANVARVLGGKPVVLQVGRPILEYLHLKRSLLSRGAYVLHLVAARVLIGLNERLAAGIGTVSEYVARRCERRNPNVRAIPWYGVDTDVFAPRMEPAEARRRLGLPVEGPIVLYRSRLAPEKDPRTFCEAVARLRAEGHRFTAAYMGGESDEMRAVAEAVGVEVVCGDVSSSEEIPLWYAAADVDVQISLAEGLGLSPLEAMACGTPVVCTDTGGLPEVVDGGRCGLLVPPRDPGALARALARLLDDPAGAGELGRLGRAWVAERYRAEDALRAWAELIEGVANPSGLPMEGVAGPRVLFVDHEHRLSGGQRDLVDLVRGLDDEGLELHAALPAEGELAAALRAQGVEVHLVEMPEGLRRVSRWDLARRPGRAAGQLGAAAGAAWRLTRLGRRLHPDIVHANSLKAHVLAVPAARASGARLVWHVRDILDARLGRLWSALAGLCADRVISLSEAAAEPFRTARTGPKVRVVHNGVRPRMPGDREVGSWRERLAPEAAPLVGIVGQLARWKGQDVFVEAAARLAKEDPDVRFAVVGSCLFPDNESDYVAELRDRVEALGLADRLSFVDQVDPVEPVMAAFDVLVHASRLPEPFGRVVVEGMALGVPVVASAIGAGPEVVPPDAGRLVPPDEPQAVAAAVRDLLDHPTPRERLAAAASRFDLDRTAAGVRAVYGELGL